MGREPVTAPGTARPGVVPPDWTGGRLTREAVLAATGDGDLAAWAARRWPHGDFTLAAAREGYGRHLAQEALRRDGAALSRQDVRIIVSLLAAKGIASSGSPEIAVRDCGRHLTALAARLKILADGHAGEFTLAAKEAP